MVGSLITIGDVQEFRVTVFEIREIHVQEFRVTVFEIREIHVQEFRVTVFEIRAALRHFAVSVTHFPYVHVISLRVHAYIVTRAFPVRAFPVRVTLFDFFLKSLATYRSHVGSL